MNIFEDGIGVHPFPRSKRNLRVLVTLREAVVGCEYSDGFVFLVGGQCEADQ